MPENETLLTYEEAAELLSVSPVTLRKWVLERRIPHYKLGKSVRFAPRELADFLASHHVEAIGGRS
jgi:excisionase family DNA binding protein